MLEKETLYRYDIGAEVTISAQSDIALNTAAYEWLVGRVLIVKEHHGQNEVKGMGVHYTFEYRGGKSATFEDKELIRLMDEDLMLFSSSSPKQEEKVSRAGCVPCLFPVGSRLLTLSSDGVPYWCIVSGSKTIDGETSIYVFSESDSPSFIPAENCYRSFEDMMDKLENKLVIRTKSLNSIARGVLGT